jgi:hypothetical protein
MQNNLLFRVKTPATAAMLPVAVALVLVLWPDVPIAQSRPQAPPLDQARELAMKITAPFTVVAVGDLIQMHPVSQLIDPSVQSLLAIVRKSDLGFANMESNLVDMANYPAHFGDHTGPKEVAADVKAMGLHPQPREQPRH